MIYILNIDINGEFIMKNCCHGHGNHNCHNNHGNYGRGRGRRRELFEQKYEEYLRSTSIPEFENDEDYENWLTKTEEGQRHFLHIQKIKEEVNREIPWGGRRMNAGRKSCGNKIPFNRRIDESKLEILKDYAQKHNITETEALEIAIEKLLD